MKRSLFHRLLPIVGVFSLFMVPLFTGMTSTQASAQTIEVVQAHGYLENYPRGAIANILAAAWEKATNGRVKVTTYHNGTLYKQSDAEKAVIKGDIQVTTAASFHLSTSDQRWAIVNIDAYYFNDRAHLERFMASEKGGGALLKALEKNGVLGVLWYDPTPPMKEYCSAYVVRKPVKKLADFQGQKIRMPPCAWGPPMTKLLGANAVSLNEGEVASAMQLGVVDGYRSSLTFAVSYNLYTGHALMVKSWAPSPVIVNAAWWKGLPPDVRSQLEKANKEVEKKFREEWWKGRGEDEMVQCRKGGMQIIEGLDNTEALKWRELVKQVLNGLKEPSGAKPTIAELMAEVERLR